MMERVLYLTGCDYERLKLLLDNLNRVPQNRREDLCRLEDDLATCQIVTPEKIPANVVSLNSAVRYLNLDSNKEREVTLVFPSTANSVMGRISVAVPLGAAILGRAVGDIIDLKCFDGTITIRIEKVIHQPETVGKAI